MAATTKRIGNDAFGSSALHYTESYALVHEILARKEK